MGVPNKNPWRAVLSVWAGGLNACRRLPLLVAASLLAYIFLSAYLRHYMTIVVPRGLASELCYLLLHATVFAPLVVGTILVMGRNKVPYPEIWSAPIASVGAIIAIREIGQLALVWSLHLLRPQLVTALNYGGARPEHGWFTVLSALYLITGLIPALVTFLLSVRLSLVLPLMALGGTGWKSAFPDAWRAMRGHYGFAIAVSIAALLPVMVSDYILGRLYARLSMPSGLPVLPVVQWEALLVRSAELTLDYIILAALAAGLYKAIQPGPAATIAPSPSHTSPAHRPAL